MMGGLTMGHAILIIFMTCVVAPQTWQNVVCLENNDSEDHKIATLARQLECAANRQKSTNPCDSWALVSLLTTINHVIMLRLTILSI